MCAELMHEHQNNTHTHYSLKLVMLMAWPRAMSCLGGSLFWADQAACQPPALSHPEPAKP